MKIQLAAALLLISSYVFAQSTTETEYNYLKRGIQQTDESGLDIKKGYKLIALSSMDQNLTVRILRREKDNSIAGIVFKYINEGLLSNSTNYIAMPAANMTELKSYGWNEFYNDMQNAAANTRNAIYSWIAYRMAYEMVPKQ